MAYLKENPKITIPEIAENLGLTTRAIEKHIGKLQTNRVIQRIGGRKEGHWEVIKDIKSWKKLNQ